MNVPPRYYDTRYPDFYYPFEFGSNSIMNGVRDNAILYIPKGSFSAYSKAVDWRDSVSYTHLTLPTKSVV